MSIFSISIVAGCGCIIKRNTFLCVISASPAYCEKCLKEKSIKRAHSGQIIPPRTEVRLIKASRKCMPSYSKTEEIKGATYYAVRKNLDFPEYIRAIWTGTKLETKEEKFF